MGPCSFTRPTSRLRLCATVRDACTQLVRVVGHPPGRLKGQQATGRRANADPERHQWGRGLGAGIPRGLVHIASTLCALGGSCLYVYCGGVSVCGSMHLRGLNEQAHLMGESVEEGVDGCGGEAARGSGRSPNFFDMRGGEWCLTSSRPAVPLRNVALPFNQGR